MKTNIDNIKNRILSIRDLPTLPTVAMELMALTQNPDSSIKEMVGVITNDPSITSKVLRIANSAFYGMSSKIDTINRALVILGTNEVNNLVTSISIFKTFPIEDGKKNFDRKKFWEHCAVTGEIAKAITLKLGLKMQSEIFTAGLLHDVGKIILDQYFHEEFTEALNTSYNERIPLYEAEKNIFGANHSQIGGWIAERWKLPRNLTDAILYHHKPTRSLNYKTICSIINVANSFSKISDHSFSGEDVNIVIEDSEAWKIITNEIPKAKTIDFEKFTFELEELIKNAQEFINIVK